MNPIEAALLGFFIVQIAFAIYKIAFAIYIRRR